MIINKIPAKVYLSPDMVQQMNDKHGWFTYRDAQSGVSNAFANEAVERHERLRAAALDMYAALKSVLEYMEGLEDVPARATFLPALYAALRKAEVKP